MKNQHAESNREIKSLPLFMLNHTVVDNNCTIPREGIDFVYNESTQMAEWMNPDATNKWSPTAYSDTKVDGVDYISISA